MIGCLRHSSSLPNLSVGRRRCKLGQLRLIHALSSLKACDPDDFPNLYVLLKIAATLPVTSCECERSINTMRRLNNYMRCTMGESRLSSLAIIHIKYDMLIDLDELKASTRG